LIAALVVWIAMRSKVKTEYARARGEMAEQVAVLTERLQSRDQQFGQAAGELERRNQELAQTREALTDSQQRRASAEERNSLIPKLEEEARNRTG
jgi:hypothetical protein